MSGTLPTWLERLLGIESQTGEGTRWRLETTWAWPPWLTIVAVAVLVGVVVLVYLRESREATRKYRLRLAAIRVALVALVLMMIAQLAISLQKTGLPYLVIIIDDSQSMATGTEKDNYEEDVRRRLAARLEKAQLGDLTRLNLAKLLLLEDDATRLSQLRDGYKLRIYCLTSENTLRVNDLGQLASEIRSLESVGESTRLGDAVRAVLDDLRGSPPAAIVLLTDGINTDGATVDEAAEEAKAKGVPLFAAGLGDDRAVRDLAITDLLVEDRVFVGDVVIFEFKLTGVGFAGQKVQVVLRENDSPRVLARTEAAVGADDQPQQLRLSYQPTRVGDFQYVVEVRAREGEQRTDNNSDDCDVRVEKPEIEVLLVQAYPSYEYKYLEHLLARDKTVNLTVLLQEADEGYQERDATVVSVFPHRLEDLRKYDVIVFGDVNPTLLSRDEMQHVAEFVEDPSHSGGVVFIAGPLYNPMAYRDTPLAALLPVQLARVRVPPPGETIADGFVLEPTDIGLASPPMQLGATEQETRAIWADLRELYWFVEAAELKRGARVLAQHPTQRVEGDQPLPLIAMQFVGAGRVLFHATDETWRWRFRIGDEHFGRYWIQTIRYLARSRLLRKGRIARLDTDQDKYRIGEPVRLTVRFFDPASAPAEDHGVKILLRHDGRTSRQVTLKANRQTALRGVYEGVVEDLPSGKYQARLVLPPAKTETKGGPPGEQQEGLREIETEFVVETPPGEGERLRMAADVLQDAATKTRGQFARIGGADELLDNLPSGQQVLIETLSPIVIWDKWPVLLLFVVLLVCEWLLRKRRGMV